MYLATVQVKVMYLIASKVDSKFNLAIISPIPNFGCYGAWLRCKDPTICYCSRDSSAHYIRRSTLSHLLFHLEIACPVPYISRRATYIAKTLMLVFGIAGLVLGLLTLILRIAVPQ